MSRVKDDLELKVDAAHLKALELAGHVIEYVNAYKALSAQSEYAGRRRLRYANLLMAVNELGMLLRLLKECERAVTARDPIVKVVDYYSSTGMTSTEAVDEILREAGKSETLFQSVKKMLGREPSDIDFTRFKDILSRSGKDIPGLAREMIFFDIDDPGVEDRIPEEELMDMLLMAVEMNARGAADFLSEWARAKELGPAFRFKLVAPTQTNAGMKDRRYYVKEPILFEGEK
ncbi:MAG TPA: hypothetical protein VGK23_01290 [Methanomassiliicoccales archaeon]|jgi:hypothetical protein